MRMRRQSSMQILQQNRDARVVHARGTFGVILPILRRDQARLLLLDALVWTTGIDFDSTLMAVQHTVDIAKVIVDEE